LRLTRPAYPDAVIAKEISVTSRCQKITGPLIQELFSLIGKENVFAEEPDRLGYASDEMPNSRPYTPGIVVKPRDTESISRLLAYANEKNIPVIARGAGTGLSGGCIAIQGGIVLSLERMNHILEIDVDNFAALVEAGVTLTAFCDEVEKYGLYYPLRPGTMSSTIGGNVGTNAGGMNAVKYGVTRHHVLGLEAVLADGTVFTSGGKYVKCATAYDLTQLLIGSEGTLAIVTKVLLKLSTRLPFREILFVPFMELQDAIDCVPEILKLPVLPNGIEFMERDIIEVVEKYKGIEIPQHDHNAFLMIIMEGNSAGEIADYLAGVESICRQHGSSEAVLPSSEHARRQLIEARENFGNALQEFKASELIDIVVPRSEIARFLKQVKQVSREHDIHVFGFGHAGDGNIHLHPVCTTTEVEEWKQKLPGLLNDIYRIGRSMGGMISGEHGIGYAKKKYLAAHVDSSLLKAMKGIKKSLDPNNILNPGKIFDLEQ
jgi:glycolate oxidase